MPRNEYPDMKKNPREGSTADLVKRLSVLSEMNSDRDQLAKDKAGAARERADEMYQITLELQRRGGRGC